MLRSAPLPDSGAVVIIDRAFQPATFEIAVGGTIEWRSQDGEAHTVTSTASGFDSGILESGATFSQSFDAPDTHAYVSAIHPEMQGTITVSEPDPGASAEPPPSELPAAEPTPPPAAEAPDPGAVTKDSIIDRTFRPEAVSVAVGDTLTWSNDDGHGHTVTAVDGSFNSGVLPVGAAFSTELATAGTLDYFCAIHPEMRGVITVTDPAP